MLINESGLVRAIKSAYRRGGYTVSNQGENIVIYNEAWFIKCKRAALPRKVLSTIVEHMGMIPGESGPVSIVKNEDPQQVIPDTAKGDMDWWRSGERAESATMVPVTMQGYQIFQLPGGGACYGVPYIQLEIIERQQAEYAAAELIDENRLLWKEDGVVIIMGVVRKSMSSWAKAWERAVWIALEGVDLHKEDT